MTDRLSTFLIVLGTVAIVAGVLMRFGLLSWFGNLPGDIRAGTDSTRVYVPITSMLLVGAVLSVVATLIAKMLGGE